MRKLENGLLLRIIIGESDTYHGKPLYEQLVLKAREMGLAGATAFRGIIGFGASSHLHMAKFLRLSEDLPIVIEVVDTEEHLEEFLKFVDEVVKEGIITIEKVKVLKYVGRKVS